MGVSRKTRLLNFFRRHLANPGAEKILVRLVRGRKANHIYSRFVPMPELYASPSWRSVTRNDLIFRLDISDFVDWYVYFGFHDEGYTYLLKQVRHTDFILDVGANIGHVSLQLAQRATDGYVTGFEPSPKNFEKCSANIRLNSFSNLTVENLGVGSKAGVLYLASPNQHNRGMNRIMTDGKLFSKSDLITIITIDSWVAERALSQVDLIKIDVEGFEMQVLKGAEQTIARFGPRLFLEVNQEYLRQYNNSVQELFEWLSEREYKASDVSGKPINNSGDLLRGQLDIYAIRQ